MSGHLAGILGDMARESWRGPKEQKLLYDAARALRRLALVNCTNCDYTGHMPSNFCPECSFNHGLR